MKDKMSISGSNNQLPKELTEYIHTLLTEVLINGEDLNRFRKWLKKYCDDYKTDFESVNAEIEDFIELIVEYNNNPSKVVRKSLGKSGSNLFLKLNQIEQLITKYKKTHPSEKKVEILVNDEQRKDDWEDTKIEDTIDKRKKETEKRKREKKRLEEENNRRIELDDIRKREKDDSREVADALKRKRAKDKLAKEEAQRVEMDSDRSKRTIFLVFIGIAVLGGILIFNDIEEGYIPLGIAIAAYFIWVVYEGIKDDYF